MRWSIRLGTRCRHPHRGARHLPADARAAWRCSPPRLGAAPGDALSTRALHLVLLFACVVLHELGHALTAQRYGIRTREIVLLPIGGVARLERMPEKPAQELVVAIAGPAVNVVLATDRSARRCSRWARRRSTILERAAGDGTLEFLLLANLTMLLFNLVPAFPMDGGRVLRASAGDVHAVRARHALRLARGAGLRAAVRGRGHLRPAQTRCWCSSRCSCS